MTGVPRLFLASAVLLAACGAEPADPWTIVLTDHPDPLTEAGADKLFTLRIDSCAEELDLDDVMLAAKPVGGTLNALVADLTGDTEHDGFLGSTDTLTGLEPSSNWAGVGDSGKTFIVNVSRRVGPAKYRTLWEGNWIAN